MSSGGSIAATAATAATAPGADAAAGSSWQRRSALRLLNAAFVLFNSTRMLAYLPTTWAIWSTGDSSQHSLWTWCIWLGANFTMAAWLHERNGQRVDRAVLVNIGNATMCLVTLLVILQHRV